MSRWQFRVHSFAILSGDRKHQEGFDCIDGKTASKLLGACVLLGVFPCLIVLLFLLSGLFYAVTTRIKGWSFSYCDGIVRNAHIVCVDVNCRRYSGEGN